jgi:hypothetical protein
VWGVELRQYSFYERHLEGLPTSEMNQQLIEGIVAEQRRMLSGNDPYLIQPRQTPIKYDRGAIDGDY